MGSENPDDWETSLESSIEPEEEGEEVSHEEVVRRDQLERLQLYVRRMAYHPVPPPKASYRTEQLAKPKKTQVLNNYLDYKKVLSPELRSYRLKRLTGTGAISAEQFEKIIRGQQNKELKKENMLKRKQELYYEMLSKLERQCRSQYLNLLIKKFASFIAKLATTMRIPPELVEPYSRMQRGLFCNILYAIGVQPSSQSAMFYSSPEAMDYEICHKLAHALLSLIIKGLDSATSRTVNQGLTCCGQDCEFDMDNYIKDRLMCAAERKIVNNLKKEKPPIHPLEAVFKKCHNYSVKHHCD